MEHITASKGFKYGVFLVLSSLIWTKYVFNRKLYVFFVFSTNTENTEQKNFRI